MKVSELVLKETKVVDSPINRGRVSGCGWEQG